MPVRQTLNSFSSRLRARRKELGLTQEELAEAAGISHGSISRFEKGEMRPAHDTLLALAEALSCSPGDLISGGGGDESDALREARDLLGRIPAEDLPGAVKALKGFVREGQRSGGAKKAAKKKGRRG